MLHTRTNTSLFPLASAAASTAQGCGAGSHWTKRATSLSRDGSWSPGHPQWPQTRLQKWVEGGAARGVTPTHPELGDLFCKDHWVTGVGVCRRVGLPLSTGSQGPVGQLRACSQLWAPGTPVASPSQAPVIPKLRGGG